MMKRLLLLVVVLAVGFAGMAQENWSEVNSNLSTGLGVGEVSASMNNADALWALAINDNGSLAGEYTMSTDAGQTWAAGDFNPVTSPSPSMIFGVDENEAWTVMNSSPNKGIWKTTDGGANWAEVGDYYRQPAAFPNVVHFFNDNDGFCQGDPVDGYYELYTTTDGGDNWDRVPEANIPAPLSGEYGITGNYDAIGDYIWYGTNMGRVFYSTDKGQSWEVTETQFGTSTTVDCLFLTENYGLAFRSYLDLGIEPTINVTTDGGANWESVDVTGDMYARYFTHVPGTDMTIVSSSSEAGFEGISYSTDGGYSWSTLEAGYPFQAHHWWDNETAVCGTWVTAGSGGMYIYEGAPLITLDPPENLTAEVDSMDVHLNWDAPGGGGGQGDEFTEDFEDGFPADWTIVDNDGDSYNWEWADDLTAHSGTGCMYSASYLNDVGALTPDNYMITPELEIGAGAELSFWYIAQDPAWSGDYMEVKISTTDNEPGSFTDVVGSVTAGEEYTEEVIDLSDYEGETVYIAFNHTESTDFFYINVDDISLSNAKRVNAPSNNYLAESSDAMPIRTSGMNKTEIAEALENYNNTRSSRELIGYNVYRDGDLLTDTPIEATDYDDLELDPGVYSYTVTAVYDEGESSPAGPVEVTIENTDLDPVNNLQAEVDGNEVMLTWELPGVNPTWLHYDDGTNGNSIGLTDGGSFMTAIRYEPNQIIDYDGFSITKMKIFPAGFTCDYKLMIWQGANAGTLVYEQPLSGLAIEEWNEIDLDTPVLIDGTQELWMGYEVIEHDAGDFPAGTDSGPAVAGYGDMISIDGSSWDPLSGFGLDYNWNIQAYVELVDGVEPLKPIAQTEITNQSNNLSVEAGTMQSTYSPSAELQGYNVYRDGEMLNDVLVEDLFYTDMGVPAGTYMYGVTAVYDEGESPAEEVEVTIDEPLLLPPTDLTATTNMGDVELEWAAPGAPDEWIHWDDGTNGNSVGLTDGGSFFAAARWDTDQLQDYDGMALTKIRFFPVGFTCDYELRVWTGANAANLVHQQMVDAPMIEEWNEIMLDNMITIDASQELWIGYQVIEHDAGDFPAGTDAGPAVAGYGDMIFIGGGWDPLSELGLDYNWNIQGGVADMAGFPLKKNEVLEQKSINNENTELSAQSRPGVSVEEGVYAPMALQGYNVYRDGSMINDDVVTETMYTDEDLPVGTFEYYVTAVYDAGESEGSNTVEVTITGIDDMEAGSLSIYPVPANDFVNVESDVTVKSVRVMNHVGQLVYSNDATDKQFRINVSDFDAGVYFIQLETEAGIVTKKISIQ